MQVEVSKVFGRSEAGNLQVGNFEIGLETGSKKLGLRTYTVSPVRWDTYVQANRVENQKLNQTTAELPFG